MQSPNPSPQTVAILGLGYVGCVSAACLAHLGHRVLGVDKDEYKVSSIQQGKAPFHEPGLEPLLAEGAASGRLTASSDLAGAIAEASIALICVGTPSDASGNLDMKFLRRVSGEIATLMASRTTPLIVSIRSTVFPGINEQIYHEVFGANPLVTMVSNPEFLREGVAVKDFIEPSLIVVGSDSTEAAQAVASLYAGLPCAVQQVNIRTAEMIKYACNAYHAVKIAFANEIGALSAQMGISGQEVMHTLCQDHKLNISPAYLRPGFAFGGSCLPKDLRALHFRAREANVEVPMLAAVLPSNESHLARLTQRVLQLPSQRLGIFGLAFKENTDDLRESPVLLMVEQLIGKGRQLRIFDPNIDLKKIYGSNQQYLFQTIPHIGNLMVTASADLLAWADHIVITQKPTPELAAMLHASGKPLLNLVD